MTFGEFVREKRLAVNLSLREFCELAELDPSNWSKIERGRLPVLDNREKLEQIAELVGIERGTRDWQEFFNLAYIAQHRIPEEFYSDEEVLAALPIFFRTISGENKPTPEELDKLIELMKKR
jgi:transcriptional regulator with XRE-family HTH domain